MPALDDMLVRPECAAWLRMSERDLAQKSAGLASAIPVFRIGARTERYHPRTILAVLAARAGVPPDVIAASYGLEAKGNL